MRLGEVMLPHYLIFLLYKITIIALYAPLCIIFIFHTTISYFCTTPTTV